MIGGAGKKISTIVDLAEELYERVNELRARVESVSDTVDDTADRVERLESELAEQRALVSAIAEEQGIDVAAVRESAGPEPEDSGTAEAATE
jgi:archaellum component FlaC